MAEGKKMLFIDMYEGFAKVAMYGGWTVVGRMTHGDCIQIAEVFDTSVADMLVGVLNEKLETKRLEQALALLMEAANEDDADE